MRKITSKYIKQALFNYCAELVSQLDANSITLGIIQLGNDPASTIYVSKKREMCTLLGIKCKILHFPNPDSSTKTQLIKILETSKFDGIIIQLPIPDEFEDILTYIPSHQDVDMLNPSPFTDTTRTFTPTVRAIDLMIKYTLYNAPEHVHVEQLIQERIDLTGKVIAIVGQGKLVGKPCAQWALHHGATLISINKFTSHPEHLTRTADIIIAGAGVPRLVTKDWIKSGSIIIDAAASESDGNITGDVDYESVQHTNSTVIPSPGGIGPLTVLFLLLNLIEVALKRKT